jgi:hypothetical protein
MIGYRNLLHIGQPRSQIYKFNLPSMPNDYDLAWKGRIAGDKWGKGLCETRQLPGNHSGGIPTPPLKFTKGGCAEWDARS